MNWEELLLQVEKPSRYLGIEVNRSPEVGAARLNFVLAFPDTYEVGMSHLGLQILYGILRSIPGVFVDRVFAPWVDLEAQLRRRRLELAALASRRPLKDFDVLGFSLQYELSYTNLLNMLDLGGIPLRATERLESDPLVIAGGPGAFNPAPLADFIDAFVIGEGEEVIREICADLIEAKEKKLPRQGRLEILAQREGIYVPRLSPEDRRVSKRVVRNLDQAFFPEEPLVPLMKTIHDRVVLEIARGCTRGCRFCQAGMVWRPVRERSLPTLLDLSQKLLCATGYDEISLLSLSTGDYSRIEELLSLLMERLSRKRIALGLPSLRVETLSRSMIEQIKRVRKTSFTLAPEAGTGRMRNIINKGNSDEDLLQTAREVFQAGWQAVKLYFMIGLPGEREEDLAGIIDLSYRVAKVAKPRGQISISLSTFVPKPHTPFQWERQLTLEEIREKQECFKRHLRRGKLALRWQDGRMSLLEGLISRGDEKIGRVIEKAFYLGCRFDGWSEMLRFERWEEALELEGVSGEAYLSGRDPSSPLPWQMVECGVTNTYLLAERERAQAALLTEDCRTGVCRACGACGEGAEGIILARDLAGVSASPAPVAVPSENRIRIRLVFEKLGPARLLSHLEITAALTRALTRAGLSFVFSQGFHPHPRISFAHATSVGMESIGEFVDMELENLDDNPSALTCRINRFLPAGLRVTEIDAIPFHQPSLAATLAACEYEILLPAQISTEFLPEKIRAFSRQEAFLVRRELKTGETVLKNIRPLVLALDYLSPPARLHLTIRHTPDGSVRPGEILTQVLEISAEDAKLARVKKTATHFHDPAGQAGHPSKTEGV